MTDTLKNIAELTDAEEFNQLLVDENILHLTLAYTPNILNIGLYQVFLILQGITVTYYNGSFLEIK